MSDFPCLVRFVSSSGEVRYRLGERLVDRYLEFVAGRCRPNTLRAVASDLKAFFAVVGKEAPVAACYSRAGNRQGGALSGR
jgi:integrase/recombinase XerD